MVYVIHRNSDQTSLGDITIGQIVPDVYARSVKKRFECLLNAAFLSSFFFFSASLQTFMKAGRTLLVAQLTEKHGGDAV